MLLHCEARAIAAASIHPASFHVYEEHHTRAMIDYRAAIKRAVDDYHASVRTTWRAYGKPSTNEDCRKALWAHWEKFKRDIATADAAMDVAPDLALQAASKYIWRI